MNKSKLARQKRIVEVIEEPQGSEVISDEVESFLDNKEQDKLFDDFLKQRMIDEKRRQRAIPLLEAKLAEEEEWAERMGNNDYDDDGINIDDDTDDYKDIESEKE